MPVTVVVFVPLCWNVPLAPLLGAVKVTLGFGTGLPYWSVTFTVKSMANVVFTTACCPPPVTLVTIAAGPARLIKLYVVDAAPALTREYDEVRAYIHSLVNLDRKIAETEAASGNETRFHVGADFAANGMLMEHILLIMLEGARNARRHAQASAVSLKATQDGALIRITIDDDGIGFTHAEPPWAIASRVAELGGNVRLVRENRSGAHMEIEMKAA